MQVRSLALAPFRNKMHSVVVTVLVFVVSALLLMSYSWSSTSTIISISTAWPLGSDAMPTAARACLPRSPKTSTIRSENPLITFGCSTNSGSEFTIPKTFTIRLTLFRSPSISFKTAS